MYRSCTDKSSVGCELPTVVRGTIHQASPSFSAESQGRQCTPISYLAILYSTVLDLARWSGKTVDYIVHQGDVIYNAVPHVQQYFDYAELPRSLITSNGEVSLSGNWDCHHSGFMQCQESTKNFQCFMDAVYRIGVA